MKKIQNQTQTQKIQNQIQHTHNTNTPRKFKIKHNVLQNIRTQTHESPLIQKNQPKSNTNSIQGTKKHKLRNTKETSSRTQTHLNISTILATQKHKFKNRSKNFKIKTQIQIKT